MLVKGNSKDSAYIEIPYLRSKGYGTIKPTNIEHYYICSQKGVETLDIFVVEEEKGE